MGARARLLAAVAAASLSVTEGSFRGFSCDTLNGTVRLFRIRCALSLPQMLLPG